MIKDAIFSPCGKYRYSLSRVWDESKPYTLFIGLNPSYADAENDDRTLSRCISFAKSWGYGGVYMTNLFAFVHTQRHEMMKAPDPIGIDDDLSTSKRPIQHGNQSPTIQSNNWTKCFS